MEDRRKPDPRIDIILEKLENIAVMLENTSVKTEQTHLAMFGNGKSGIKQDFYEHLAEHKTKDGMLKWIFGSSSIAIIGVIVTIIKLFFID